MTTSEAQLRANRKHQQEKLEEIKFRVPKDNKARIQKHAAAKGESTKLLNAIVKDNILKDAYTRNNAMCMCLF